MNECNTILASLALNPVPGTNAYWAAQREAFALIEAWQTTDPDDPGAELAALRRIAAHSFAAGVMNARSAHGAGNFYDTKAAQARQLTSAIGNEDRDEDRQGVDGTANKAQRACEFAAEVGLQAYALLAAAQGAVDAYAHVVGKDWKPYEGMAAPSRAVSTRSLAMQAGAFSKE